MRRANPGCRVLIVVSSYPDPYTSDTTLPVINIGSNYYSQVVIARLRGCPDDELRAGQHPRQVGRDHQRPGVDLPERRPSNAGGTRRYRGHDPVMPLTPRGLMHIAANYRRASRTARWDVRSGTSFVGRASTVTLQFASPSPLYPAVAGWMERTVSRLTRSIRRCSRRSATHGATGLSRWALTLASSSLHRTASGVAVDSTRWGSCRSWSVRSGEYDAMLRPQPARTMRAARTAIVSDSVRFTACICKREVQPPIHLADRPARGSLFRADEPWLHISYPRRGRRNT